MQNDSGEDFTKHLAIFLIVVLVIILVVGVAKRQDDADKGYELISLESNCLKFTEQANVRSEPEVLTGHDGEDFNSFGELGEANFTMEISEAYRTDRNLDQNGDFIGLSVDDILATPEGKNWFPERIKEDQDGIVWVNSQYIEVLA